MPFIDDENSRHGNQPYEGYVINAGGTLLYFTNQPVGGVLDGVNTYIAVPGLNRRRVVRKGVGVSGGEMEIRIARSALSAYVPGFPPNPFEITITRYQTAGDQVLFEGEIANTRIEGRDLLLRCLTKQEARMGRRCPGLAVLPQCPLTLYDEWCRVDRGSHEFPATVVSVTGLSVVVSTVDGRPDGYFAGGEIILGNEKRSITTQIGTTITIDFPFNATLTGSITMHPGCDKKFETCRDTYLNKDNYQGARHMPDQNVHILGIKGMRVTVS